MQDEGGGVGPVDTPPADLPGSTPAQPTEPTEVPVGYIDIVDENQNLGSYGKLPSDPDTMTQVLTDEFQKAIDTGNTQDQIIQALNERFGDQLNQPNVVGTVDSIDPTGQWAEKYLPQDAVSFYDNLNATNYPSPTQATQIQNSTQSQGVGPPDTAIAPSPTDKTEIATDSFGQGTSSTPEKGIGGDPLILFSGQLYHQVTDLEVKGRGLNFLFMRTYFNQTLYKGPLGYNWDHSYNLWLREEQRTLPDGSLQNVVYRSTGQLREDRYIQVLDSAVGDLPPLGDFADAVFHAPAGFFDRLEKSGGKYILETVSGVRYEYNADLYVDNISDLNGNTITFEYTNQLLTLIRDPVGKEFSLEYDESNRIIVLYDKTGNRKISYTYGDNGDLEEVDLLLEPDLVAGTDYRYMGPEHLFDLQHNLIEIISPMGESVLENEYGRFPGTWEFNRVLRQRSLDGEYRYEYGPVFDSIVDPSVDPINVPIIFTRIFYPNDHCIEHWFNNQGNVVRRSEQLIIGEAGVPEELIATYRYNEDALLIEAVKPDDSATEYHYQREAYANLHGGDVSGATPADWLAFGNLLKRVERPRGGLGEIRRIVTDYTYYTQGNRLATQKGPYYADVILNPLIGQTIGGIDFDYDNHGNLIKIHYPDVTLPDGTVQSPAPQVIAYNNLGLITDITFGSLHVQYIYFSDILRSGFIQEKVEDADGVQRHLHYDVDSLGRIKQIIGYYGATTDIDWTTFDTPKNVTLPEVVPGTSRPKIFYQYNRNRQITQAKEELRLYDGSLHPDGSLVKTYHYDPYGRVIKYGLGPEGMIDSHMRRTTFTPFNLPEKEIDFLGNVTFTEYDERMLIRSITRGWGTSPQSRREIVYDKSAQPIGFIDGLGYKTVNERDAFGRPHIIRDPDGNETEIEYDAVGRVILRRLYGLHPETSVKVRWAEVEFKYDALGRFIERLNHLFTPGVPGSDTLLRTQFFYDPSNRIENIIDPTGGTLHYNYDGRNRLKSLQDPGGSETKWRYDDITHTITIIDNDIGTDESGNTVSQAFQNIVRFDSRGLAIAETDSLGNITSRGFDSRKLLTHYKDANGQEFFADYDAYGQPTIYRTKFSDHQIETQMVYDSNGRIKSITSPIGGKTIWNYDVLNRIISIDRSDNIITFMYDKNDNLLFQNDANGIVLTLNYSPTGLLMKSQSDTSHFSPPPGAPLYTPSPTSTSDFKYTPLRSIATAKNDVASLIFHYDSLGRVIDEQSDGRAVTYRYDNSGQLAGITFPDGRDISYDHSPSGRLQTIVQKASGSAYPGNPTTPSSRTLLSIWHIRNRPLTLKFESSHKTKFSYDVGKRVAAIDCTRVFNGTPILQERNLFGPRGELIIQQLDSASRIFDYDALSRLIGAKDFNGIGLADITTIAPAVSEVGLATANNQSNVDSLIASIKAAASTGGSSSRNFLYKLDDNTNRLETDEALTSGLPPTVTQYIPGLQDKYNSIGGKAIVYDGMGNMLWDGVNNYRYDTYNQLSEVNSSAGVLKLSRDPLSRPIQIHDLLGVEEFTYAGSRLIEWKRGGNIEGQIIPLEQPNSYAHLATKGIDRTPLFSIMGSVMGWVVPDATATVSSRSSYDPFGQVLNQDPNWPAPFGFAGYWYEGNSKLYLLKARGYHPRFGRFLQRDPLGFIDGMNQYAYSNHSPGTLTDYWGFASNDIDWSTAVGEGASTLATGGLFIVGLGVISALSAPVAVAAGLGLLLYSAVQSFDKRSDEAFAAGKTQGSAVLAAVGDSFGGSPFIEGITGRNIVTGDILNSKERGARLGSGSAGLSLILGGGKEFSRFGKDLGTGLATASFSAPLGPAANIPEHPGAFLAGDQGFFDITREPTYLVRAGPARPGTAYGDYLFRSLSEAESYARQIANTGEAAIRDISSLPRVYPKGAPGNPVDAMYIYGPIPENTPNIIGVTDEQTEGGTVFGNPLIYRGGGPQVVIPNNMGFGFPILKIKIRF